MGHLQVKKRSKKSHQPGAIPKDNTKMCVISPHNSAGMVIIRWCHIVKLFPAPDDTFAQSELEPFQMDRLARSYGIQKLLRCRIIYGVRAEPDKSMYRFYYLLFAIRRSACTTFSRRGLFEESKLFQNRMIHLNKMGI